jgi:hypothetical protein
MSHREMTEELLLEYIAFVSEIILLHGVKYAPLLDRLERELAGLRARGEHNDPLARAKAHLARARGESVLRDQSDYCDGNADDPSVVGSEVVPSRVRER